MPRSRWIRPGVDRRRSRSPTDVGEEVAEGLADGGLGRVDLVLGLAVLRAAAERLGDQRVPVDRERLVGQDVHDPGRAR